MNDFKEIKKNVDKVRQTNIEVVDNFLIYYAASKDRLDKVFNRKAKRYEHIIRKMMPGWKNFLKSQFIAHEIFKEGGLIGKYLNHAEVGYRSSSELDYLKLQKEYPWRYSFSEIVDNPHSNFYIMRDLFTDQEYLLFSHSISDILIANPHVRTWFNLIGFGGMCMQTYGTVCYFRSLEKQDIEFFARTLDPRLETDAEIDAHIQEHSLPYLMLWSGAQNKMVVHKEDIIKHIAARYHEDDFNSELFREHFRTEYADNIYRLPLKGWDEFPHYAIAYYDEKDETLHLTAMTMKGFEKLVEHMNLCGYDLPPVPHDEVNMPMLSTMSDVLRKELMINPFEEPFMPAEDNNEDLNDINHFMQLLVEQINSGSEPDIRKMANIAGVDYELAAQITENILSKFED